MYDILVGFFTVYIAIAVSLGILLVGYNVYLVSKDQQKKNEEDWTPWHDLGECDICGRLRDEFDQEWTKAWDEKTTGDMND